jgi:hypothetical protein
VRFDVVPGGAHPIPRGRARALRGRVLEGADGKAMAGISVSLSRGERRVQAYTDADGRFALAWPHRGDATLLVDPKERPHGYLMDVPYPGLARRDLAAAALDGEIVVRLPRIREDGAEATPVRLDVQATDAATGDVIDGAHVSAWFLRDGFWMVATDRIPTGADGRATADLPRADRYEVWVAASPRYLPQRFERAALRNELRIAAALARAE